MAMTDTDLRTKYLPGVPCWVDTTQHDVDGAVAFYRGVFGWEYEERPLPVPDARYLVARKDGQVVGGLGTPSPGGPGEVRWNTYVTVADVDEAVGRVTDHGGTVSSPPETAGPAGRSALVLDPTGAQIGLWQPGRRIGVERVNVDGAWNWSDLVTDEPDGWRPFYGAVFGWEARSVDVGGAPATMLCVPGYGEALARLDPTIRERHDAPGVPPGFFDAIGWVHPADGGRPTWRVTFATDDPDAVAAAVEAHGGRVLEAPHDVGPVRTTLVADPAGATFAAHRYQPDA
jgi:predicted enzyme related to lactoylglutathione lyase